MSRFFGSKSKTPAPTLQDQVNNCDARVKVLDDKIKGYDQNGLFDFTACVKGNFLWGKSQTFCGPRNYYAIPMMTSNKT